MSNTNANVQWTYEMYVHWTYDCMSIGSNEQLKCPLDMCMSNGHIECPLDICVSIGSNGLNRTLSGQKKNMWVSGFFL
jgi:hypothetical protein